MALICAVPCVAKKAAAKLKGHTVTAFDGFDELASLRKDPQALIEYSPDVIVLGLGARLQEEVALELHRTFPKAIICTAGGWIDQFAAKEQYFPA